MSNQDPALGLIVRTNAHCRIKGQQWADIPTLVWPEGIDEDVSDWFRTLVVDYGVATSSAEEYANILRPFLRFCRQRKRTWQSVDDEFLIIWREQMRRGKKIGIPRVNHSLKTIFAFYRWAEENKRIRFQVGIYTQADLPAALEHVTFPISAKQQYSKGRQGRVYGRWTTPLTLSNPSQSGGKRHTPAEHEIRNLHKVAIEKQHGVRDTLIFSWAEEAGLRRAEIIQLSKHDMPTNYQLADLIERDEPWLISVKRKGGVTKPFNTHLDLILRTLDFIEFERRDIVDHCHGSIVGYCEPDEIFLSGTTGAALHLDTVTAISRKTFNQAGVRNSSIHRLRARFAVRTIETLVDAIFDRETVEPTSIWVETILFKASKQMGHSNPRSLRPYLTYVLNRRIQTADATKAEKLASRLRELERHEATLVRRLQRFPNFERAARHLAAGRESKAAIVLRGIADELE